MKCPVEHFQLTLIHGPNIPCFCAVLFFTVLGFISITNHITTGHCFRFGSVSSFFLELFLHSSPVVYWAPTDLGSSSFNVISFCLFILKITTTTTTPKITAEKEITRCRMSQVKSEGCSITGQLGQIASLSLSLYIFFKNL